MGISERVYVLKCLAEWIWYGVLDYVGLLRITDSTDTIFNVGFRLSDIKKYCLHSN